MWSSRAPLDIHKTSTATFENLSKYNRAQMAEFEHGRIR